jgi:glycerophosphoryl diester phosphodiesterase
MFPSHKIFAHRGLHSKNEEANSVAAISNALSMGFSVETDIRDSRGLVVVEHDPPKYSDRPRNLLSAVLELSRDRQQTLALNVKSDGLLSLLGKQPLGNHFFFDMSAAETVKFRSASATVALRVSEYESVAWAIPRLKALWVWLDSFEGDWFLNRDLGDDFPGMSTVVVSPELHGRKPENAWNWVKSQHLKGYDVSICTDLPMDFLDYYEESGVAK